MPATAHVYEIFTHAPIERVWDARDRKILEADLAAPPWFGLA